MFEFKPAYKALAARCLKIYYNGKLISDWRECHSHKNGVYNWY